MHEVCSFVRSRCAERQCNGSASASRAYNVSGEWVVRQSGYDSATGRRRVKQLETFPTKRAAVAHQKVLAHGRAGSDGETLRDFVENPETSYPGRPEGRLVVLGRTNGGRRLKVVPAGDVVVTAADRDEHA